MMLLHQRVNAIYFPSGANLKALCWMLKRKYPASNHDELIGEFPVALSFRPVYEAVMNGSTSQISFGVINVSDRASAGVYEDLPGKEAVVWLKEKFGADWSLEYAVVPDDAEKISSELVRMADVAGCCLVLTTGGTGPAPRDVTPEATTAVCHRLLPGFGEAMRMESFRRVPTSILSRQVAGTRGRCLIINLPGKPTAIRECLDVVAKAIPYCVFLTSGLKIDGGSDRPAL